MSQLAPPITDAADLPTGQRLVFGEWPGADPPFVFAHGLTSSHRNIAAVAREMAGAVRIVAPDLRGRGLSSKPPSGNYGMEAHAADVLALMDTLEIDRAVVGGHSMGAYVASTIAALEPSRVLGLVLIDGGVIYIPPGSEDIEIDPDVLMESLLKPVMERIRKTFASPDDYRKFFEDMPYWGDQWTDIVEDYIAYDMGHRGAGFASKCSEAGATDDWRDLLVNQRKNNYLARVKCPVLAVAAGYGMTADQPSVLSDVHLDHLRSLCAEVDSVRVPDTSHHTVTLSPHGAKATAGALRKFVARVGT